jgi:hypothetical protein
MHMTANAARVGVTLYCVRSLRGLLLGLNTQFCAFPGHFSSSAGERTLMNHFVVRVRSGRLHSKVRTVRLRTIACGALSAPQAFRLFETGSS